MYKLIACDLDETLLGSDRHVSQRNIDAILKAQAKGVYFVPATGRGYLTVDQTLKEIGLNDLANQYVISFNGSVISENKDHKLLHFETLDRKKAEMLYNRGLRYDVMIHVYTASKVFGYNYTQNERDYLGTKMFIEEVFSKQLDFTKDEIVKVLYMNTNKAYLESIQKELTSELRDLEVSYSSNRYMEFNKKGVSKGSGLQRLCNLLDIDIQDSIAIGDNSNDLSMIKQAGLGVGVANSAASIKPYCDYVCEATNNQSAIAEVIEKFIL